MEFNLQLIFVFSVVVREDKKLLTVLFPDGRDGRAFTLKVLQHQHRILKYIYSIITIFVLLLTSLFVTNLDDTG